MRKLISTLIALAFIIPMLAAPKHVVQLKKPTVKSDSVKAVAIKTAPTTAPVKPAPQAVAPVTPAPTQPDPPQQAPVQPAPVYPVSCAAYEPMVEQYNWNVHVAMAIMQAESGCNPDPPKNGYINWDGVSDYGLFQLHGVAITDPADNIAFAYYHKYVPAGGFTPWTTYTSGRYLKYLN